MLSAIFHTNQHIQLERAYREIDTRLLNQSQSTTPASELLGERSSEQDPRLRKKLLLLELGRTFLTDAQLNALSEVELQE